MGYTDDGDIQCDPKQSHIVVCRTLLLAGIATALIFGGLSLKKLTESRATETLKVVEVPPAKTHLLQEPYADLYVDKKKGEEPCGDSCDKDHAHRHAAPVRKYKVHHIFVASVQLDDTIYRCCIKDSMLLCPSLIMLMQAGKKEESQVPFYFMVSMACLSIAVLLFHPGC